MTKAKGLIQGIHIVQAVFSITQPFKYKFHEFFFGHGRFCRQQHSNQFFITGTRDIFC